MTNSYTNSNTCCCPYFRRERCFCTHCQKCFNTACFQRTTLRRDFVSHCNILPKSWLKRLPLLSGALVAFRQWWVLEILSSLSLKVSDNLVLTALLTNTVLTIKHSVLIFCVLWYGYWFWRTFCFLKINFKPFFLLGWCALSASTSVVLLVSWESFARSPQTASWSHLKLNHNMYMTVQEQSGLLQLLMGIPVKRPTSSYSEVKPQNYTWMLGCLQICSQWTTLTANTSTAFGFSLLKLLFSIQIFYKPLLLCGHLE